jgi:hypothetical protein
LQLLGLFTEQLKLQAIAQPANHQKENVLVVVGLAVWAFGDSPCSCVGSRHQLARTQSDDWSEAPLVGANGILRGLDVDDSHDTTAQLFPT